RIEHNAAGFICDANAACSIRESALAQNTGSAVGAQNAFTSEVTVEDCLITGNGTGASASVNGTLRIADSCVSDNGTGLAQSGGGTLLSRVDNTVEGNTTDTSGTIGTFSSK